MITMLECAFMHSPISISYSVRLHVARSTQMGKARASRSGMSNRYRLSRFLFYWKLTTYEKSRG